MAEIDLTKGGVAVVLYGNTGLVKEYQNHPAIIFINGQEPVKDLTERVPSNTRTIVFTDGLAQMNHVWVTSYCRQKNIPWLLRKSNQAVYETLKSFFPNGSETIKPTSQEVKDEFVRGKLNVLIPHIDFAKSNAENAKILMRKAQELSIKSTEASLAQFVANHRRKQSGTAVPKSARSQLDVSVDLLDEMIKNLGDMRDYLIATTEENRLLKQKLEKFKKAFED